MGELRGKAIFALLDHGEARDIYSQGGTSLAGRSMFVDMEDPKHPLAALMLLDDPVGEADQIHDAVTQGILVRTRADTYDQSSTGDTSHPAAVDGVYSQALENPAFIH
ncbi:MAG: hypothetical protein GXP62_14015 [Oligoflexia bacterium]|nr:hypothetical protein [Oligoflexia bacterium]